MAHCAIFSSISKILAYTSLSSGLCVNELKNFKKGRRVYASFPLYPIPIISYFKNWFILQSLSFSKILAYTSVSSYLCVVNELLILKKEGEFTPLFHFTNYLVYQKLTHFLIFIFSKIIAYTSLSSYLCVVNELRNCILLLWLHADSKIIGSTQQSLVNFIEF